MSRPNSGGSEDGDTVATPLLFSDHGSDLENEQPLLRNQRAERKESRPAFHFSDAEELKRVTQRTGMRGGPKHFVFRRDAARRRSGWIRIDKKGIRSNVEVDKRTIAQNFDLGIPLRDMRLLDSDVRSHESGKILVRDNAIVVSIEHVRLIISADCCLIPRDGFETNPATASFVETLEEAILDAEKEAVISGMATAELDAPHDDDNLQQQVPPIQVSRPVTCRSGAYYMPQLLPFELVVLEVALSEVCGSLGAATHELEAQAMPAMDALLKRVSKSGLDRVRKLKARQQRIQIRVQAVRDELTRYMDDDEDMRKFCLTRRKEVEMQLKTQRSQATMPECGLGIEGVPGAFGASQGGGTPPQAGNQVGMGGSYRRGSSRLSAPLGNVGSPTGGWGGFQVQRNDSYPGHGFASMYAAEEVDADAMEAVENLLETYFTLIDNTYDKIVSLDEYIKDTEEYLDIELDWNRNRLIKLEILLTAATFAIAPFNLVAGILGENVVIPHFMSRDDMGGVPFYLINLAALLFCTAAFTAVMMYTKYKKLL